MNQKKGITILVGLGFGLVNVILIIGLLKTSTFIIFDWPFIISFIVATTIPFCIRFVEKFKLNVANICLIMTATAMVICGIYAYYISKTINTLISLIFYMLPIYSGSLVISIIWKIKQESKTVHR